MVLAREMTLEEIAAMTAGSVEIEVFVHGALCICYSGQCQMSRLLAAGKTGGSGGRSGNRGLCAHVPADWSTATTGSAKPSHLVPRHMHD